MKIVFIHFFLIIFLTGCGNLQEDGRSPLLKVSENGRYLETNDGNPFFWMGETIWGMSEWLNREEVDFLLDDRMGKGFNVIQVCLFWGKREEEPLRFTVNPPNAYGHSAFNVVNGMPDTASPDIADGGSPDSPNDYWDHVEYILRAAEKRNMVVALLPVWGRRYVNGIHTNHSHKVFTESSMHAYGKFLAERFGTFSNIIWVIGGDVAADHGGDFQGHYRKMAEGIISAIAGKEVGWAEESSHWKNALMTYHPDGIPFLNSSEWFHNDPWLDFNMIETWNHRDSVVQAVSNDYQLKPVKPTVMAEPGYEGVESNGVQMRRQAYQSFFTGAAGFTYGAAVDNEGNGPLFSPGKGWKTMLDKEGAKSMQFVKKFCKENNWPHWTPDPEIIISKNGEGEYQKVAVSTDHAVMVYFPDNSPVNINLSKHLKQGHGIKFSWYNPTNGEYSEVTENENHSETIEINPPDYLSDAVFVLYKDKE
jgi:hypothetical protein